MFLEKNDLVRRVVTYALSLKESTVKIMKYQYKLIFTILLLCLIGCSYDNKASEVELQTHEVAIDQLKVPGIETARTQNLTTPENIESTYEILPKLYLTLDPSNPPFKSKLISIDLKLILSKKPAEMNYISEDFEFLGRDPNLTWAPDLSKAVFVNMNGVYLFNPVSKQFTSLPTIPFHQTSASWNRDSLHFAMVVENGKAFSSDVLLMDASTGVEKLFSFDAHRFPTILGWINAKDLLLFEDELGLPKDARKVEILERRLFALNTLDGSLKEILPNTEWLNSQGWKLSLDGNFMFYRQLTREDDVTQVNQAKLVDMTALKEQDISVDQGFIEWVNSNEIVVYYTEPYDSFLRVAWFQHWVKVLEVKIEGKYKVTEILPTPDGKAVVVFLTEIRSQPGVLRGYKAIFLTKDGQQEEFLIPGFTSTDWIVQFAAWGK